MSSLDALHCPDCGYSLRGLGGKRCPECGYSLADIHHRAESGIAWVHRHRIGWFRAYWSTVCSVSFRHKRFCDEIARPIDYADAQRFRWVTILHVYLPLVAASVFFHVTAPADRNARPIGYESLVAYWPLVVPQVFGLPLLIAVTGVASYFFHPKALDIELQNRAIALSLYSCAVLAWTPFIVGLLVVGWLLRGFYDDPGLTVIICTAAFFTGLIVAWWFDLMHIARRTMPHIKRRAAAVAFVVPLLWIALAGIFLGVLPLSMLYVFVIFASLR